MGPELHFPYSPETESDLYAPEQDAAESTHFLPVRLPFSKRTSVQSSTHETSRIPEHVQLKTERPKPSHKGKGKVKDIIPASVRHSWTFVTGLSDRISKRRSLSAGAEGKEKEREREELRTPVSAQYSHWHRDDVFASSNSRPSDMVESSLPAEFGWGSGETVSLRPCFTTPSASSSRMHPHHTMPRRTYHTGTSAQGSNTSSPAGSPKGDAERDKFTTPPRPVRPSRVGVISPLGPLTNIPDTEESLRARAGVNSPSKNYRASIHGPPSYRHEWPTGRMADTHKRGSRSVDQGSGYYSQSPVRI